MERSYGENKDPIRQARNTLNVWFDDPAKEYICEETSEEVILVKDRMGRVIGFERLNFLTPEAQANLAKLRVEATVT